VRKTDGSFGCADERNVTIRKIVDTTHMSLNSIFSKLALSEDRDLNDWVTDAGGVPAGQ
jgi:hypothetical protein